MDSNCNAPPPPKPVPSSGGNGGGEGLYASFRHHITGKVYYAKDYGYEAWPIGRRKKK